MKLYIQLIQQVCDRQKALAEKCRDLNLRVRHRRWHLSPDVWLQWEPYSCDSVAAVYGLYQRVGLETKELEGFYTWTAKHMADLVWSPAVQARPREALRRVRILQALCNWLQARIEGLDAQVAELKRQQKPWNDKLEAELALAALVEQARAT